MKQAITTKYIRQTNHRPSRVKATTASGISLTIPFDSDHMTGDERHAHVARLLAIQLDWDGQLVAGSTRDGFVFVFLD